MRTLTLTEMVAVSGGQDEGDDGRTWLQDAMECVMDVVTFGAAGGALGLMVGGPLGGKIGAFAGMSAAIIGSEACNAALGGNVTG